MKKILYALTAGLMALTACSKGDYNYLPGDVLGGQYIYNYNEGRQYMMLIADDLVTGVINELELAMEVEARGLSSSSHFKYTGSFYEKGSLWRVKAEGATFKGMEINCVDEHTWHVSFEGDLDLGGNSYPTTFSLTAKQLQEHSQWGVTLKGSRTERGGYYCTFETHVPQDTTRPPYVTYANTLGDANRQHVWNNVVGDYYLTVYNDDKPEFPILSCLSFNGLPSQAIYTYGL